MSETCDGIRYLLVEDLIAINRFLIETQTPEEPIGVISPNELASAQQKPANHRYYKQTIDMVTLSAVFILGLASNHCFVNANKRTAAAAGTVFLMLNGWQLTAPEHSLVEELLQLIAGPGTQEQRLDHLEDWIAYWVVEFDPANNVYSDSYRRMMERLGPNTAFPVAASASGTAS